MLGLGRAGRTIFICYRRSDTQSVSGRLYDCLVHTFWRSRIFKDTGSLPFGVTFSGHISKIITSQPVMLVMVGPRWLDGPVFGAVLRLSEEDDPVRREICQAMRVGAPLIPVCVGGAPVPSSA